MLTSIVKAVKQRQIMREDKIYLNCEIERKMTFDEMKFNDFDFDSVLESGIDLILKSMVEWENVNVNFNENDVNVNVNEVKEELKLLSKAMVRFCNCEKEVFIVALVYVEKVNKAKGGNVVTFANIRRVLFISLLLAMKMLQDAVPNNLFFGFVGKFELRVVNGMEAQFLKLFDYNMNVARDVFDVYVKKIVHACGAA